MPIYQFRSDDGELLEIDALMSNPPRATQVRRGKTFHRVYNVPTIGARIWEFTSPQIEEGHPDVPHWADDGAGGKDAAFSSKHEVDRFVKTTQDKYPNGVFYEVDKR